VICWKLHLGSLLNRSFVSRNLCVGFADELVLSELDLDKVQYHTYKPPYGIGRNK